MLATRSVGWRLNTPWTTSDAIVSWMARSDTSTCASGSLLPKPNVALPPHAAAKRVVAAVAEVERDRDRRLGEPGPHRVVELVAERAATCRSAPGTGAGRTCTMRAPRSISESTSASAASGSASESIGAAMRRSS